MELIKEVIFKYEYNQESYHLTLESLRLPTKYYARLHITNIDTAIEFLQSVKQQIEDNK